MRKQTVAVCLGIAVGLGLAGGDVASAQNSAASAAMRDGSGRLLGTLTLSQTAEGIVATGQLSGMPPGTHGLHIHEVGLCESPFTSAGEHWNPTGRQHGVSNPAGPHVSDLYNTLEAGIGSNVRAGADGVAPVRGLFRGAALSRSPAAALDADGSAVILHAGTDDNVSDPAGNAGGRIACGVIVAGASALPRTGNALPPPGTLSALGAGMVTLSLLLGLAHRRRAKR